ncbi:Antifungal protein [Beauveria brongniartii RCEF 3172]|uniref:Antifungal protein n=1 Tax=Beauveria brongniartii RCEF 3172 TaxID=1081107 RepID=A0A166W600_9HYPO|nr:Antifungal protein [Beauveria brongniartii RCEF 3172]
MQIISIALFLLTATGAVAAATPEQFEARDGASAMIKYHGVSKKPPIHVHYGAKLTIESRSKICTKAKNECKFKGQNGKDTFVKCPNFANKRCTKDHNECSYDSVTRAVVCH